MDFYIYLGRSEILTTLAGGSPFFDGIEVGVSDPAWKHRLSLLLGVDDGRPVLNRLSIERLAGPTGGYAGKSVTSTYRDLTALDRIFKTACEGVGWQAARRHGLVDEAGAARAAGARRRQVLTDDFLRKVSDVARAHPEKPTEAVAKGLFTSHRTASRWIAAARAKGLMKEESK